ncbi:MAG: helix-turn-helix transcriptional regulator [Clostridia bacterium]|nr:helix-turn-helix transcriptional regulator [Clostridia bacterium]
MKYYAVPIEKTPNMRFAHRYRTDKKQWELAVWEDVLEISYLQSGNMELISSDGTIAVPQGSIVCCRHDLPITVRSCGDQHVHYTVAMQVEKIALTEELSNPNLAYLPILLTPDANSSIGQISEDIMSLVNTLPGDRVKEASRLLRLLSHMNDAARGSEKREHVLCHRVKRYVEQHLDEELSPAVIAEEIGISYGHLSRIFKAQEGMTIVRYITRARLGYVRELLMLRRMTLEEAGLAAGFTDVKYLSRCFHRECGITAREYIRSLK